MILENGLRGLYDVARDAISDTLSRMGTGASLETGLSGASFALDLGRSSAAMSASRSRASQATPVGKG